MKRDTIESIVWIFCIVILFSLSVKVEGEGKDYSCNQCTVTLKNKVALGEYVDFGEYKIINLFQDYNLKNECLIKWDPTQGYYKSHEAP